MHESLAEHQTLLFLLGLCLATPWSRLPDHLHVCALGTIPWTHPTHTTARTYTLPRPRRRTPLPAEPLLVPAAAVASWPCPCRGVADTPRADPGRQPGYAERAHEPASLTLSLGLPTPPPDLCPYSMPLWPCHRRGPGTPETIVHKPPLALLTRTISSHYSDLASSPPPPLGLVAAVGAPPCRRSTPLEPMLPPPPKAVEDEEPLQREAPGAVGAAVAVAAKAGEGEDPCAPTGSSPIFQPIKPSRPFAFKPQPEPACEPLTEPSPEPTQEREPCQVGP